EVEIVQRMGVKPPEPSESLSIDALGVLQGEADRVFVAREVVDYAVNLVFASREPERFGLADLREFLSYGASPRASLGLIAAGRALALLRGRSYVLPQDVYDVAPDIFRHRMVLSYEALARDVGVNDVLGRILSTVPAPRVAPSQDHSAVTAGPAVAAPSPAPEHHLPPRPVAEAPSAGGPAPTPWVPPSSVPSPPPARPAATGTDDQPDDGVWSPPGDGR
ncbi:MAG: hypothetical protein KDA98_04155, partial [Acidimicrobiales bacterium]|nr:hypothetical protein [Acidimicrobiales bacterium]